MPAIDANWSVSHSAKNFLLQRDHHQRTESELDLLSLLHFYFLPNSLAKKAGIVVVSLPRGWIQEIKRM
jgi:hypothetical protein